MIVYHMSPVLHPVGTILKGNGRPKVELMVEETLEQFRPKEFLGRLNSVFGREITDFTKLGLDGGYIYRIAMRGDCQRHDAVWLGLLQLSHLKLKHTNTSLNIDQLLINKYPDWTDKFVESTSTKYWTGVASDQPLWEVLSLEAEIEVQLSDAPVTAAATKGGWQPS